MQRRPILILCAAALAGVAGCGDDEPKTANSGAAATTATGEYAGVKSYLLDHTARLTTATGALSDQATEYRELFKANGDDGKKVLAADREKAAALVTGMQKSWQEANPSYEEAEGVVAGVPSLAEYDVILDAGAAAKDDPEGAVPFDLKYEDGTVLKQPGNYFALTETALWGTEPAYVAKGVEADLDGDGKVEFGEALPNPQHIAAAAKGFDDQANKLQQSAEAWKPTESDVFNAVVVMTPTMSEYFEAWKNSRFVAGDEATEASFVGASRLQDIAGILQGITVIYDGIEPQIKTEDPQVAEQAGKNLDELLTYVEEIRDQETEGETFTPKQADTYGTEAQRRAEAIAGQVSQAADALGIKLEG